MPVRFGPVRRRVRAEIKARSLGRLPTPRFHEAIQRAQELNAATLLLRIRNRYSANHMGAGHPPSGTNTIEGYESNVRADQSISVFNRRRNAARIERGVDPKAGMQSPGSGRMKAPPARVIESPFGTNLRFFWEREGVWMTLPHVHHPGQRPDPIMAETLAESEDDMFENIVEEVGREISRG